MPDGDFFPPIDIHREWIHDIIQYNNDFFRKHRGAREIFNVHKYNFFRNMYEYCDNYNVVLTGKALEKLANVMMKRIIYLHNTYFTPNASKMIPKTILRPLATPQLLRVTHGITRDITRGIPVGVSSGGYKTKKRTVHHVTRRKTRRIKKHARR